MAFQTQQVNSFSDIQLAIESALAGEGWTLDGDAHILSKNGLFVKTNVGGKGLRLFCGTGASGGALTGMPNPALPVNIGQVRRAGANVPMPFPARILLFTFSMEVYLIVNTNVEEYQYLAFGQSGVPGIPGTGNWHAGSLNNATTGSTDEFSPGPIGGAPGYYATSVPGIFFDRTTAYQTIRGYTSYVHHGFTDAAQFFPGWEYVSGQAMIAPFYQIQPNAWNSESVLLPLRAYASRPENFVSLAAELKHARLVRLDFLAPEQIVQLGPDKWMVLPWFKKNPDERDGGGLHTGTLGWAIRYP